MKGVPNREMTLKHIKAMREIKELDVSPYERNESIDNYLLVKDPYPDSNFYFKIYDLDSSSSDGVIRYTIDYKPHSEDSTDGFAVVIPKRQFKEFYDGWVKLVESYSTFLEESIQGTITEGYEEEYFSEFDIVDEDADTHSYNQNSQKNIDEFLAKVAERLIKYKDDETLSDDVIEEINVLLNDIAKLRNTQARSTKRQVFKKVINIMARCRKAAPKVAWEIGFEVVKTLLIDAVTNPQKYLDAAKPFLES